MPAQAACLRMFAPNQRAPDHGCSADARSQGGHDHIVKAASGSSITFSQQRHASVIFNSQEKAKFPSGPFHEIDADLVVIDPNKRVRLTADVLHTRIDYSIYDDVTTQGYPVLTVSRGEIVMEDGEFLGKKGRGRFVPRTARDKNGR